MDDKPTRVLQAIRSSSDVPLDRRLSAAGLAFEDLVEAFADKSLAKELLTGSICEVFAEMPDIIKSLRNRAKQGNVDALKGILMMMGENSPIKTEVDTDVTALSDAGLKKAAEHTLRQLIRHIGVERSKELVQEVERETTQGLGDSGVSSALGSGVRRFLHNDSGPIEGRVDLDPANSAGENQ